MRATGGGRKPSVRRCESYNLACESGFWPDRSTPLRRREERAARARGRAPRVGPTSHARRMRRAFLPSLALPTAALLAAGCAPPLPPVLAAAPTSVRTFVLDAPPAIGAAGGVEFVEGGLSGLTVRGGGPLEDLQFVAVTDRGPNADAEGHPRAAGRPVKLFPFPDYGPALLTLRVEGERLLVESVRRLARPDGGPITGRPPPGGAGADVLEEAWADTSGTALARDPWGLDAEGVAATPDGDFWVADEYRPSLWLVDGTTGRVRQRHTPIPSDPADRPLPPVLTRRRPNLGFEGVAVLPSGRVVAVLQGPLDTPDAASAAGTRIARLLVLDPASGEAAFYVFALDGPGRMISDVAALGERRVLVVEHGPDAAGMWSAQVYRLDLDHAAPLTDDALPEPFLTPEAAEAAGFQLAPKTLVLDLLGAGWTAGFEKPEGLAVLDARTLAVINDNDYGLATPNDDGVFVPTGLHPTLHVFTLPADLR